jgi:hypothetical protein
LVGQRSTAPNSGSRGMFERRIPLRLELNEEQVDARFKTEF